MDVKLNFVRKTRVWFVDRFMLCVANFEYQTHQLRSNRCVFIRVFLNAKSNENLRGCEPFLFDRYSFECSQQRFICSGSAVKAMLCPGWTAIQQCAQYFDLWTTAILLSFVAVLMEINMCNRKRTGIRLQFYHNRSWFISNGFIIFY